MLSVNAAVHAVFADSRQGLKFNAANWPVLFLAMLADARLGRRKPAPAPLSSLPLVRFDLRGMAGTIAGASRVLGAVRLTVGPRDGKVGAAYAAVSGVRS